MSNEITMPKLSDTMEEGKILRWLKRPGDKVSHGDALAEVETDKADMILEAFDDGVLGEIKLKEGDSAPVGAVIALMDDNSGGQQAASPANHESKPADPTPYSLEPQANVMRSSEKRARTVELRAVERKANGRKLLEPEAEVSPKQPPAQPKLMTKTTQTSQENSDAPAGGSTDLGGDQNEPADAQQKQQVASVLRLPIDQGGEAHKLKASPLARRAAEEAGIDLAHIKGSGPDGRITKQDVDNFLREQQLFRQ